MPRGTKMREFNSLKLLIIKIRALDCAHRPVPANREFCV